MMMHRLPARLAGRSRTALLALGLTLAAGTAAAAPPTTAPAAEPSRENVEKAVTRYQRGQEFYTERNFAAALVEFRKAYELAPNYRVLYNIGQVCFQMQDYVCALRSLEQYLGDGGADLPDARRQSVEQELRSLKSRVGYLDVHANAEGAELSVDDTPAGTLPLSTPLPLGAGRHRLTVTAPGRSPVTRTVDIAGQDTAKLDVSLPQLGAPSAATSPVPGADRGSRSPMTTLSWVGYGVGAGLLVGGGVTGVLALGPASDVRSKVYANEAAADSDRSKAKNLALVSDILLGAGIVAVAATTIYTFVVPHGSRRTQATLERLVPRFTF